MNFRYENGRRYHAYKEGSYHLPNDEEEIDRLDFQHHIWRHTLDGALYLAPLPPSITTTLDVGTGTGIWAIELADAHPGVSVVGTDLSPIQPNFVPPNCRFELDDAEADWVFNMKFDFIHARMVTLAIRDWDKLFRQSFDYLKPGGWIEVQEFVFDLRCEDGGKREKTKFAKWGDAISGAAAKVGIDARSAADFGPMLERLGFENWRMKEARWPVGPWPDDEKAKQLGEWAQHNFLDAVSGVSLAFLTRIEGWKKEDVDRTVEEVRKEINDPGVHQYLPIYVHYAQKPMKTDKM